ncbi:MAG: TIGR04282 family arsenosugar biosynthesis glycosyltransferase [Pleurocapsa sp.]
MLNEIKETLIIFSRYPEAGKTKTRMIPVLGAVGAAKLQQKMTEHTINTARKLKRSRDNLAIEVHFTGGDQQLMADWLGKDLYYYPQVAGDLGQKMRSAFARAFQQGNNRVVTIGTDCPDIDEKILTEAFQALEFMELEPINLVLGAALDGGYYTIGLSQYSDENLLNSDWKCLFDNIAWGTDKVFQQTKDIANHLKLNTYYLPLLRDIDRPEDLEVWYLSQS